MKKRFLMGWVASVCLLAHVSSAYAYSPAARSPTYTLDWMAAGEVSGGGISSSTYRMQTTMGQMGAQTRNAAPNSQLASGFQAVEQTTLVLPYKLYLPMVILN